MYEVGQEVYVKKIGNCARNVSKEKLVTEEIVETVGRKYFTLVHYYNCRFFIEDGKHDGKGYMPEYRVYTSLREVEEEMELQEKCQQLSYAFEYGHNRNDLSIEDIRTVHSIVFKKKE